MLKMLIGIVEFFVLSFKRTKKYWEKICGNPYCCWPLLSVTLAWTQPDGYSDKYNRHCVSDIYKWLCCLLLSHLYSYLKLFVILRMSYLHLWRIWTSVVRFRI